MTVQNRRAFLKSTATLSLFAPFVNLAHALPRPEARFALVILRGGLDGLTAAPAYGEGRYRALRRELALPAPDDTNGILKLDGLFGLHPSLARLHELYLSGEASVVHAAATPYRERSHFDAQKVLEAGGTAPSTSAGGWLNRALTALAAAGGERKGIALASSVPLVLQGPFTVASWAPSRLPDSDDDTLARIRQLYEQSDRVLAARLTEALNARDLVEDSAAGRAMGGRNAQALAPLAVAAGRFLASEDGPRVAVLDVGGWDTHANQAAALTARLRALDEGLASFKDELGRHWASTSVLIVTEFGRTVAVNGTRGTDHGTATCAFLAGGAIAGGRVIADWPGLGERDLRDGRDLEATLDLRAVFKGLLAGQFGLSEAVLEQDVFPDSAGVRPLEGLLV
jgi:uncharacterized protein (DUF1501 family)